MGELETISLKRLEGSSFKNFDKLLKKTRDFAKKRGIKSIDVKEAIKRVRSR